MLRGLHTARSFTESAAPSILLREFIHRSLYSPTIGYFNRTDAPVGALAEPFNFSTFSGEAEYKRALNAAYSTLQESWLTPVEVFQPYYGQALASYIQQQASGHRSAIHINEVGGGTGTLARNILDYLHKHDRDLYERLSYTSIEISPKLAGLQQQRLGDRHAGTFTAAVADACCAEAWGPPSEEPCFILMMEVLDNLPHDRVGLEGQAEEWCQTEVEVDGGGRPLRQHMVPITDTAIGQCMQMPGWQAAMSQQPWMHHVMNLFVRPDSFVYLPTQSRMLLDLICHARPQHRLIIGDFDELPDVQVPGKNAPLVASKEGGITHDHKTLLVPPGSADIFFPTDFPLLAHMHAAAGNDNGLQAGVSSSHMKGGRFMRDYAQWTATSTQSGYNPILQDYTNFTMYLGGTLGPQQGSPAAAT